MKTNPMTTSLRDNVIVDKTDPRIELRGKLDSLYALATFVENMDGGWCKRMNGFNDLLFGLYLVRQYETDEIDHESLFLEEFLKRVASGTDRERARACKDNWDVDIRSDEPSAVNYLRTQIREAELVACTVCARYPSTKYANIHSCLNALSSMAYWIAAESE